MTCHGGNERIARRLQEYQKEENRPLQAVANQIAREVVEAVRKNGEDWDYSDMLEARVAELGLREEDVEIIEGMAFRKVGKIAQKMGMEFDPIGEALTKMATNEKLYKRALRQVEAEGWQGEDTE